jgi:hypothetical protein
MNDKEMITKIQEAESKAWKYLRYVRAHWGEDDEYTYQVRFAWCALNDLRKTLNIDSTRERELKEIRG